MTNRPAVLVHPPLPLFESQLGAYGVVHWPTDRKDISAAVGVGSIGMSNDIIAALPKLKTIACFAVGVDGFDLEFLRGRGVALSNGANINHEDVADVGLGLIIAVARRFSEGERVVRAGNWAVPLAVPPQKRIRGRQLGIVGLGAIGQALAVRAEACGMEIRWAGPRPKPDAAWPYEPDLIKLAKWADILAVCVRGDPSTVKLINADVIKALGGDGILVNVSRGNVVDEDALIAALKSGGLYGAGLDVFEEEPTPPEKWAGIPNVTLTPHLGGGTREALVMGAMNVMENLRRHFAGEPLLTPVE
jgi:lactate dehydrogenase-like 2-hydroxyacid dehydrogenase